MKGTPNKRRNGDPLIEEARILSKQALRVVAEIMKPPVAVGEGEEAEPVESASSRAVRLAAAKEIIAQAYGTPKARDDKQKTGITIVYMDEIDRKL